MSVPCPDGSHDQPHPQVKFRLGFRVHVIAGVLGLGYSKPHNRQKSQTRQRKKFGPFYSNSIIILDVIKRLAKFR